MAVWSVDGNAADSLPHKPLVGQPVWAHLADRGDDLSDYPAALEVFFAYIVQTRLEERIAFTDFYPMSDLPAPTGAAIEVFDPVNPDNNVAAKYAIFDQQRMVDAAQDAFDAISEAAYAEKKGRAVDLWQVVLGPTFRGDS